MTGQGRPLALASCVLSAQLLAATALLADEQAELRLPGKSPAAQPTPIEDDANLHDVQFIGTRIGWAVGDHGVIWHTEDGGQTWDLVRSPVTCPLRSVCFLSDRVGWIAGGGTTPHTRLGYGVVLFTEDGGKSWRVLGQSGVGSQRSEVRGQTSDVRGREPQSGSASPRRRPTSLPLRGPSPRPHPGTDRLPNAHYVRFFNMQQGVVAGEATTECPTGVVATSDGGKTWQPAVGPAHAGWRAADFVRPDTGVTVGMRGQLSLVGGGRMLRPRVDDLGLRGLRGVRLDRDETGWLVGDGGLVLRTDNGGVVWQSPPAELPEELRDVFDFRAVARRGEKVWVAGRPGSVVWHSPDGGRTWLKQHTGQTAPIHALDFHADGTGWAAGALGMILRTNDGGQTWTAVRGNGRRAALLAVHARPSRVSLPLLAKLSGDEGYRSVVLLPARRDIGPDGHDDLDLDLRLGEAVTGIGGSSAEIGWQFPVAVPGLEHDFDRLLADWNRRTDGRLREAFLGKLVCRLRTWRPSVVVIDQPPRDDATTRLLNEAILQAVRQAADPTFFIKHAELAGLKPWQVEKVFWRLPAGSTADAGIDPHEYLPRLGRSAHVAAATASSLIGSSVERSAQREAYRLILDRTAATHAGDAARGGEAEKDASRASVAPSRAAIVNRDFFSGISIAPGSDARRRLVPIDGAEYEAQFELARRQRNLRAATEQFLDDPHFAAQLVAQLREVTEGMRAEQAALQLVELAEDYKRLSRWDLAEATLIELIERYPDQPVARSAMRWLFQWWSGVEPAWQRATAIGATRRKLRVDSDAIVSRIERATELARTRTGFGPDTEVDLGPDPVEFIEQTGHAETETNRDARAAAVNHWREQAVRMASLIRRKDPGLFRTPQVHFPLASLLRSRGIHRLADRYYRRFQGSGSETGAADDPWRRTAQGELWLLAPRDESPKPVAVCKRAPERPVLDGLLSDACWQDANEIRLTRMHGDEGDARSHSFALLSWDAEHLYFAASILRAPGAPQDRPVQAGRTHDADLSKFDRIGLFLDLDRDYTTYYALHVDQRGWTAESCWEDAAWNPKWYVAATADETHWRVEAAIPWKELGPGPPAKKSLWAVGIVRIIPAVGIESWTHPAGTKPRPEGFGLVRFE